MPLFHCPYILTRLPHNHITLPRHRYASLHLILFPNSSSYSLSYTTNTDPHFTLDLTLDDLIANPTTGNPSPPPVSSLFSLKLTLPLPPLPPMTTTPFSMATTPSKSVSWKKSASSLTKMTSPLEVPVRKFVRRLQPRGYLGHRILF